MANISSTNQSVRVDSWAPIVQHAYARDYFDHIQNLPCPTCKKLVSWPDMVSPIPYRTSALSNIKSMCNRGQYLLGDKQEFYIGTGRLNSNGNESFKRKEQPIM